MKENFCELDVHDCNVQCTNVKKKKIYTAFIQLVHISQVHRAKSKHNNYSIELKD